MNFTKVEVFLREDDNILKAFANMVIDDSLIVRNIKVIEGSKGLFVAMPNRKLKNGEYRDVVHPLNSETRAEIEQLVLDRYEEEKSRQQD